ncbi:DNA primase [Streptomyces cellulosae]|uniref:DNA primase n=1 Tax=Streptomyces thermocarboxydus TaxID=59299 RepID=A0ABU3J7W9_9ACTN|nr:DNA primase [Streptomyces cellulosae]MDT6970657.1 DNA primase [Streptomyces thermocarboxydus]MYQ33674.1 DNA primase [Streptomyces sp. SID4956]MYQ36152.1 DNA primase [Streptomyces sp. SID4956]WSB57341.1 DNA primase [Streptomyces cellulosae]
MNRTGLGLAIGAGYLLGRTKKLKMALAVGGLVAGKKLNLSPRAVADLVGQQLRDNPQFKELGDQLRGDLRGAGKAASGALVERQLSSLADRLHGRTAEVRGRLAGGGEDRDAEAEDTGEEPYDEETDGHEPDDAEDRDDGGRERGPDAGRAAKKAAKKAPAKKGPAAKKAAPAKRAAGGPAPAKKAAAARKTAAKKTAASRGARSRPEKGGGE